MKKTFLLGAVIIIGLCLANQTLAVAPAFVQGQDTHWSGGSGTTESITFGSNITASNLVACFVAWQTTSSTVSSIKDNNNVSYTLLDSTADGTNGIAKTYYLPNSAGGANARIITVTWSADPGFGNIQCQEVSGIAAASPVDGSAHAINFQNNPGTSANAVTSGNVTTAQADYIFGASFDDQGSGATWTAGTNVAFTGVGTNGRNFYHEYFVQSSSGTVAAKFTNSASGVRLLTAVVAFLPSSDTTAPVVTAFTIPATSTSLTISITTFTATDAVGVTGYKLTESATPPLAGDAGWTASAPTTYTFAHAGSKTLYAWAKDAAGNISSNLNQPVTITLPTYTVGGTISGLSGTVVLQNNGGDNLSRSANGSFTFATPLNDSLRYAVTVLTQPAGQTCAMSNDSGTIAAANVTNITVTCANNSVSHAFTVKKDGSGDFTTIQACATAMAANDTCTVYAGIYNEHPTLTAGTAGNLKTMTVNSGDTVKVFGFTMANYTAVNGFEITGSFSDFCIGVPANTTQYYVTNNNIHSCGSAQAIHEAFSSNTTYGFIQNNTIAWPCSTPPIPASGSACQGILINGDHHLIENNDISHVSDGIALYGQYNVIRGNTFHDVRETDWTAPNDPLHVDFIESQCTSLVRTPLYNLYEGNSITNSLTSNSHAWLVQDGGGCPQGISHNLIVRFNKMLNLGSYGLLDQLGGYYEVKNYNNTMDNLGGDSSGTDFFLTTSTFGAELNNIFYNVGPDGTPVYSVDAGSTSGFRGGWNLAYNSSCGGSCTWSGRIVSDTGNIRNQNPLLVNTASDLHLQSASPARDAGTSLTSVASDDSGSGTSLIVNDASFFQDGSGIATGDSIAVGTVSNVAKIVHIEYTTNVITLATSLSRASGDPVYLYKDSNGSQVLYGTAPDMGAYEFNQSAPTVTSFTIPATASSLTVSISSFTATDSVSVTGYKLTESAISPLVGDAGWTASAPTTYTFSTSGSKTLYAWAKNGAGNVSASLNASVTITLSSSKAITGFTIAGETGSTSINESNHTIALTVPYGTAVTALAPTITQTGSSVSPASGVAKNFTTPQTYTVTAADASSQDYVVTVSVGAAPASGGGGGGGCISCFVQPSRPTGGFSISINHNAETTSNRVVTLDFNANPDIKKMAISVTGDFTDASQVNYAPTIQFDLCSKFGEFTKNPTCPNKIYTVFVKFYTLYGIASPVVTSSIALSSSGSNGGISNGSSSSGNGSSGGGSSNSDGGTTPKKYSFTRNLSLHSTGSDVRNLQKFLNSLGFIVAKTGAGSPGKETTLFGAQTQKALIKYQKSIGLSASGFFGPLTRAYIKNH